MAKDREIVRVSRGHYDLSIQNNGQIGQKERLNSKPTDSVGGNSNLSNLSDLSQG
jgi:hypothetical protein